MKKFLLIVVAVIALIGVSLLFVPKRYINTIAEEALVAEAHRHNVRAHFDSFDLTGSSFRATRVQLFSAPFLLGVDCDAPQVELSIFPLLSGTLDGHLRCNPYLGSLDTRWQMQMDGSAGTIALAASELVLGEHPQIAALGFSGGALSISEGTAEMKDGRLVRLNSRVTLSKLARKVPLTLSDYIPNTLPITVPAFDALSIRADISFEGGTFELRNLVLQSDWGRMSGDGRFTPARQAIDGQLQIRLSDAGVQFLGPYLPLLPPGGIASTERNVRLLLSGRFPMPRLEARRM